MVSEVEVVGAVNVVMTGAVVSPAGCERAKAAFTVTLLFRVKVQLPVPLHGAPHPANIEPAAGVAVRVTVWPVTPPDVQRPLGVPPVLSHLMEPADLTDPLPLPEKVMETVGLMRSKNAEVDVPFMLFGVTVQVVDLLPEQVPPVAQ